VKYVKREVFALVDIEKIGRELMGSEKGSSLRALAESSDGKAIESMVSQSELESAVRSGDMDALKGIMERVLATEQGRRIAKELGKGK